MQSVACIVWTQIVKISQNLLVLFKQNSSEAKISSAKNQKA